MKKKIVLSAIVFVFFTAVGSLLGLSKADKNHLSDIQIANIEALSSGENGNGGTPVDKCYMSAIFGGNMGWHYFCNSETTENMIYACPSQQTYGSASTLYVCTK